MIEIRLSSEAKRLAYISSKNQLIGWSSYMLGLITAKP
jgi:hypothetical protein